MSMTTQVLVIGAEGTGKTLLLKRLQKIIPDNPSLSSFTSVPSTVSTVGTNLVPIAWYKRKYEFRELGGPMAPIWKNYYSGCHAVIFMIDRSNVVQLSAGCILFYDILSSEQLSKVSILLILNKCDLTVGFKSKDLLDMLRLNELGRKVGDQLQTVTLSCATGEGISQVINWIQNLPVNVDITRG